MKVLRPQWRDQRLAELIRTRQPCVALTGAGVSTESGIPDFRSAEGIWAEVDPYEVAQQLSLLMTRMEASYSVTSRLQQLSLMNYL